MPHRVLCIEGNEAVRASVRGKLEGDGFAVELAATGLEGIARALALPPDLVLADVHLPDLEGTALAARLRRERSLRNVPFVAVGASAEEHDLALAAGYDGVIADPASVPRLGDELRAYLGGKREALPEEGERTGLRALASSMAGRLETALVEARGAQDRLAELARLRSAFIDNLAHELSTPLTPLAGYLRILRSGKLGPLAPQLQKVVEAMSHAVARLARVVDNLADFADLGSGEATLLGGAVDPDALADAVVEELRPAIAEARLHVEVMHAGGGPVPADGSKLQRALANVIANAVKFSPHGGDVLVEVAREPGRLRFTVYDQGPGVPAAEIERIFEPLHHAASRGSEDARLPGSGLGLPVARRIAEAHGGRLTVESPPRSQPGRAARHYSGSKFVLEIPDRSGAATTH
ncbi:MAG TPA: hybrid sensor histidine kinase/response regulator [Anaeromyxobacteraceae bacterium]|nr:hybrid sensor histidine kinase/response regulator [Anaeromyxobacteraceae bacterium]